jgi:hypothetical protein
MAAKHTPPRWQDADERMARECEKAFQNGGPRLYVRQDDGSFIPLHMTAAQAVRLTTNGTVYARRKVGGRYVWRMVTGSAS